MDAAARRVEYAAMTAQKVGDIVAEKHGDMAALRGDIDEAMAWYIAALRDASGKVRNIFKDTDGNVHGELIRIMNTGVVYGGEIWYHHEMSMQDRRDVNRVAGLTEKIDRLGKDARFLRR